MYRLLTDGKWEWVNDEPKLISVSIEQITPSGGYRVLAEARNLQTLQEARLAEALTNLQRLALRYAHVTEFNDVWNAIAEAQTTHGKKT